MNAIRAFIAIELSSEIRQQIDGVTRRLKSMIPNAVRWVPANNIHLTLKFLGESSPANLALLGKSLPAVVGRHQAFAFQVGSLGAFPNIHRPRVIWLGVQAPPALTDLYRCIETETQHLGYEPEERGFSAHLTIGRVNQSASPADVAAVSAVLSQVTVNKLGSVAVKGVILFRSDLNPAGSIYTPLATFPLAQ